MTCSLAFGNPRVYLCMCGATVVSMLQIGCAGLEVSVTQDAETGATSLAIETAVKPTPSSSAMVSATQPEPPSLSRGSAPQADEVTTYLETCLKSVVTEKCHLQQALEDLVRCCCCSSCDRRPADRQMTERLRD